MEIVDLVFHILLTILTIFVLVQTFLNHRALQAVDERTDRIDLNVKEIVKFTKKPVIVNQYPDHKPEIKYNLNKPTPG